MFRWLTSYLSCQTMYSLKACFTLPCHEHQRTLECPNVFSQRILEYGLNIDMVLKASLSEKTRNSTSVTIGKLMKQQPSRISWRFIPTPSFSLWKRVCHTHRQRARDRDTSFKVFLLSCVIISFKYHHATACDPLGRNPKWKISWIWLACEHVCGRLSWLSTGLIQPLGGSTFPWMGGTEQVKAR